MKICVLLFVSLILASCSGIDAAQKYIDEIQKLNSQNQVLQSNIKALNKKADRLTSRNNALEKMSEERINKFWSMYDTGV